MLKGEGILNRWSLPNWQMQFSIKNQLVLLPPLSLVCTLYIENREPTRGSERYRDYEGFRFVEKQRADLHGKSLISLVITVRHRMEYVFMIILYRMIISSASPHNRIVDRLYHTVWRSEELCSVLAVLRLQSTTFFLPNLNTLFWIISTGSLCSITRYLPRRFTHFSFLFRTRFLSYVWSSVSLVLLSSRFYTLRQRSTLSRPFLFSFSRRPFASCT